MKNTVLTKVEQNKIHPGFNSGSIWRERKGVVCGGSLLFSHDDFCFHSLTLSVFVYKENSVAKEKKTFQNVLK